MYRFVQIVHSPLQKLKVLISENDSVVPNACGLTCTLQNRFILVGSIETFNWSSFWNLVVYLQNAGQPTGFMNFVMVHHNRLLQFANIAINILELLGD